MGNSRKKPPVVKKNPNMYQTASELPDAKKEKYSSIVEDFDKETLARVEEIEAQVNVMKTNIKQVLRRTLLQMPRNVRQLKAEDFYYEPKQEIVPMMNQKIELNTEFAKVAESVNDLVLKDFSKLNIKPKMTKTKAKQNKRKKSSILLAEGMYNIYAFGNFDSHFTKKQWQPRRLCDSMCHRPRVQSIQIRKYF